MQAIQKDTTKKTCPDCGPAPTIHIFERTSARLQQLIEPYLQWMIRPFDHPLAHNALERGEKNLLSVLSWIGIVKKIASPDEHTPLRAKCVWDEATRRGMCMREFRILGRVVDMYEIKIGQQTIFFHGLPRPKTKKNSGLEWMDNKWLLRNHFVPAGIPMARGGLAHTHIEATKLFGTLRKPVIVKPHIGSRGRHTTTRIDDEKTLLVAIQKAQQLSPWVIIEEELLGTLYRVIVIGGKVVGVLCRDRASVIGDGVSTMRSLLSKENAHPLRIQGDMFMCIPVNEETESELQRQKLNWESIPKHGEKIYLSRKPSRSVGGGTEDELAHTHKENIKLFERVARVLEEPIVGIDFIIGNINEPWYAQSVAGVIECNSLPFIDLHHYPLRGPIRNAAGALLDIIFPQSIDQASSKM